MSKTAANPRAKVGHNSGKADKPRHLGGLDDGGVKGLKAYVSRVERVEEEIAALNADKADIYAEAKGRGYDVPTLKKAIRRRHMDPDKRDESDELLELYEGALEDLALPSKPEKAKGGGK